MTNLHKQIRLFIISGICFLFMATPPQNSTKAQVHPASTETGLPNVSNIIKEMAQKHPNALKIAYNAYPDKTPTIKGSEFQDRVIQKLHSTNPRFGYVKNVNLRLIYTDLLCYSIKKGDPKGATSSELYAVDFIAGGHGSGFVWWKVHSPEELVAGKRNYTCVYPRPGAPDYTSGGGSGEKMSAGGTDKGTSSGTVKGVCDTYRGDSDVSCITGHFHPHPGHADNKYRWTCRNIPHKRDAKTNKREIECRQSKETSIVIENEPIFRSKTIVAGVCDTYRGDSDVSCITGHFHPHPGHADNKYRWTCRNIPHKRDAKTNKREIECRQSKETSIVIENEPIFRSKTIVAGVCDTYRGDSDASCTEGRFYPHPGHADNKYRWTCRNIPHKRDTKTNKREIECHQSKETAHIIEDKLISPLEKTVTENEIKNAYRRLEEIGEKLEHP